MKKKLKSAITVLGVLYAVMPAYALDGDEPDSPPYIQESADDSVEPDEPKNVWRRPTHDFPEPDQANNAPPPRHEHGSDGVGGWGGLGSAMAWRVAVVERTYDTGESITTRRQDEKLRQEVERLKRNNERIKDQLKRNENNNKPANP